ncbi:response regulator transcription factor [Staphylococcus sp. ACRSN]|uniref:response regulator transcription factor n=1 Tax=Staphylococcus sp. ACRSN TaxID=2918214 RepID=UPI0031BA6FA7
MDDHLVVREGLKMILEIEEKYEIVAEASNGKEGLKIIEKYNPDIILLDLKMPEIDGTEVIEILNKKGINTPIIILTTYNEEDLIKKAITLGAKGYLLKDTTKEKLFNTINTVVKGETVLSSNILNEFISSFGEKRDKSASEEFVFTEKEKIILKAIAQGDTSKKIALDLKLSERTVKAYLTNIYTKLGVSSRSEAVAMAFKKKIII